MKENTEYCCIHPDTYLQLIGADRYHTFHKRCGAEIINGKCVKCGMKQKDMEREITVDGFLDRDCDDITEVIKDTIRVWDERKAETLYDNSGYDPLAFKNVVIIDEKR